METRRHERAGAASVWAAATLKQSVLILLPRTVTFETISSGTTHKERHGGKINHSAPPTEPFAAHCLRGLQKLIRENLRILAGAVLGWVWPRCPINSFQSGSSLNDPPPPTHTPHHAYTHTRAFHASTFFPYHPIPDVSNKSLNPHFLPSVPDFARDDAFCWSHLNKKIAVGDIMC